MKNATQRFSVKILALLAVFSLLVLGVVTSGGSVLGKGFSGNGLFGKVNAQGNQARYVNRGDRNISAQFGVKNSDGSIVSHSDKLIPNRKNELVAKVTNTGNSGIEVNDYSAASIKGGAVTDFSCNEDIFFKKKVKQVSGGGTHSLFLTEDGKVYAAGSNQYGQLGVEHNFDANKANPFPTQIVKTIGDKNIVKVSAGESLSLFLADDGTVYGTGSGAYGDLGYDPGAGSVFTPVLIDKGLEGKRVIDIVSARDFSLLLTDDGEVYGIGSNRYGQLAIGGENGESSVPNPVATRITESIGDKKIVAIAAGGNHSLFLTDEGEVYTTGWNMYGQLGYETKHSANNVPALVGGALSGKRIVAVGASNHASFFITDSGDVYAAGNNSDGQFGGKVNNEYREKNTDPVLISVGPMSGKKIVQAAGGNKFSLFLTDDGKVYGAGNNSAGQLGRPDEIDEDPETKIGFGLVGGRIGKQKIREIAAGDSFSMFLTDEGDAYTAGGNNSGELGSSINAGVGGVYDPVMVFFSSANIMSASVGKTHSLFLTDEGKVYAAGQNEYGQLGLPANNNPNPAATQVTANIGDKNVIAVAAGDGFSLFLTESGEVYGAGNNKFGQIGGRNVGTDTPNPIPELISVPGVGKVTGIIAGGKHSLFIKNDSYEVYGIGNNKYGQLGSSENNGTDNPNPTPIKVNKRFTNSLSGAAGEDFSLLLEDNGQVYSFGTNKLGQLGYSLNTGRDNENANPEPTNITDRLGNNTIVQVAAGDSFSLFLTKRGQVYSVGENRYGQLGTDFNSGMEKVPVSDPQLIKGELEGKRVANIAAGGNHSLFVVNDGMVYAAGLNNYGQLGTSVNANKLAVNQLPLPISTKITSMGVAKTVAGGGQSLFLVGNGSVYGSGNNEFGQLATKLNNGTKYATTIPALANVPPGKYVLRPGDTLVCTMNLYPDNEEDNIVDYTIKGYDPSIGEQVDFTLTFTGRIDEKYYVLNVATEYGLPDGNVIKDEAMLRPDKDYELVAKVTNTGHNDVKIRNTDVNTSEGGLVRGFACDDSIFVNPIKKVSGGKDFTLLLDNKGKVFSAGLNDFGQLGWVKNSGARTANPTPELIVKGIGDKNVTDIAAGSNHSLFVTDTGKVYSVGSNRHGQLGRDNNFNKSTPNFDALPVSGGGIENAEIVSAAAGDNFSLLLTKDGKVYGFGANNFGQIGNASAAGQESKNVPALIGGGLENKHVVAVSAGKKHSLFLTSDGKVYAAGSNEYGQLGSSVNGKNNINATPMEVGGALAGKKVVAIAAGGEYSMFLTEDGRVYGTGYNYSGQLGVKDGTQTGDGVKTPKLVEVGIGQKKVIAIAAGDRHTLFLTEKKEVYAAGDNRYGELGDDKNINTEISNPDARLITSGLEKEEFVGISAGGFHSLLLTNNDRVFASGLNTYGQLGSKVNNGTDTPNPKPTFLRVPVEKVIAVVGGSYHTLFLTEAGRVYAAGSNISGQLGRPEGVGTVAANSTPVLVTKNIGDKKIVGIAAGGNSSMFLTDDGNVYATGDNAYRQLGLGKDAPNIVTEPTLIPSLIGRGIKEISVGWSHAVFLSRSGNVYAAGNNAHGELGLDYKKYGTQNNAVIVTPPEPLDGKVVSVSAGFFKTMIMTDKKKVYDFNVLGITKINTDAFTKGVPVKSIQVNSQGNYVLTENGRIYAAGSNQYGQLGTNEDVGKTAGTFKEVVLPKDKEFIAVGGGFNHSVFLSSDGEVYGAGLNNYGQLGSDKNIGALVANPVPELAQTIAYKNITRVGIGGLTSMFIANDNTVHGLGDNQYGQLGSLPKIGLVRVNINPLLAQVPPEQNIIKPGLTLTCTAKLKPIAGVNKSIFSFTGSGVGNNSDKIATVSNEFTGIVDDDFAFLLPSTGALGLLSWFVLPVILFGLGIGIGYVGSRAIAKKGLFQK